MTNETKIKGTTAVTDKAQMIALKDTYVSHHNPRFNEEIDQDAIAVLAKTIVTQGLLQNLCGLLDDNGRVGIVAGRRRWHALQQAVQERPELGMIEVRVTDDLQTALAWALLENTAREEMDDVDEIRHYGSSLAAGMSVPEVARAYCVTEPHVRRRAALASLPEAVLNSLKAGDISISDAQAFTVSDNMEKQLQLLEAIENGQFYGGAHQIKAALTEHRPSATCRTARYVGIAAYKKAGGTIDTNLFDDEATINDPELLDKLFIAKLTRAAKANMKKGKWAWVEISDESHLMAYELTSDGAFARMDKIPGTLTEAQKARYDELDAQRWWDLEADEKSEKDALDDILEGDYSDKQRAMAGAFFYVANDGNVRCVEGLIKAEDSQTAAEAGFLKSADAIALETAQAAAEEKAQKPAFAAAFVEDMRAIRLAAFQTALLRHPELVLDLLGFGLSRGSHWSNETMAVRFDMEANKPKAEDDAFSLCTELGGMSATDQQTTDANEADTDQMNDLPTAHAFEAFRAKGKNERDKEITSSFARAFKTQDKDMTAVIADLVGANIREIWDPTATNCFKRMKAAQLEELFQNLLDLQKDSTVLRTFQKLKKGEKDQKMHDLFHNKELQEIYKVNQAQKARIDAWTPDCF